MYRRNFFLACIAALTFLSACGGGGDGLPDVEAARVSLGEDRSINEQQLVTINAVADPIGGNYAWSFSSSANAADIEDFQSEGASARFTAPAGTGVQIYQITVKYTSPDNKVATDSVEITVNPVNTVPLAVTSLSSPDDNRVAPGQIVILSGVQSSDIDGTIAKYQWQQVAGAPTISPQDGSDKVQYHFEAPEVESITSYIFRLTVFDNENGSDEAEITIVVDPSIITHQVLAGPDMVVNEGQTVTLTASAIPEGGNFFWTTPSGSLSAFFPSTSQSVTFDAPLVTAETTHTFSIEYQAPDGKILHDSVNVKVLPVNRLPVAAVRVTTPSILPAEPGQVVTLDPSASYDPDSNGSIVTYNWRPLGNAPAYTVSEKNELIFTAPATLYATTYVFELEVIDNEGGIRRITQDVMVSGTEELNVANAGLDQVVKEFSTVTLDGTESIIITGTALTCSWRQLPNNGPTISLSNANTCNATFTAPQVDIATNIVLELTVNGPATDTVTINVLPLSLGTMNDTGVTACFNDSTTIACNNAAYPGQDGDFGRDAYPGSLDKAGFSSNSANDAFDYTKLDENGDEMAITGAAASCVRDNVTGLIWEVKQGTASSLRSNTNTYTWFYSAGSTGGNDGVESVAGGTCPSTENCGLEQFVAEVNAAVYCGGANWRVPTYKELKSLVNFSRTSALGVIDSWAFNDLPLSGSPANVYFWTSETTAEGGGEASSWVVDFISGNDNTLPKGTAAFVRLVRDP